MPIRKGILSPKLYKQANKREKTGGGCQVLGARAAHVLATGYLHPDIGIGVLGIYLITYQI